jgi:hypothetical protein
MAFERGEGLPAVRITKLESWVETADPDLYGTGGGDVGVIREHRDFMTERRASERHIRMLTTVMAAFGGIPAVIIILQLLHVIPR